MAKNITVSLSDAEYEAVRAASAAAHQTPEETIVAVIAERFFLSPASVSPSVENFLNHLRAQGLLIETPHADVADVPPHDTPERALLEDSIEEGLSDALDQSGLSILDLIERR